MNPIIQAIKNWYKSITSYKSKGVIKRGWEWPD